MGKQNYGIHTHTHTYTHTHTHVYIIVFILRNKQNSDTYHKIPYDSIYMRYLEKSNSLRRK
jgi:hypothetical protein